MSPRERDAEFAAYFAARATALRRLAYALCGDWHAAEDLVQVTFLRLYRHWRRLRGETLDAYARRTLVNAFLSDRRRRRRETVVADPPERAARDADPAAAVDLRRALATLPPRQRAMVVLRHLEDLPVAEVAALLGLAEGTVKSQTARGVAALRAALPTATRDS
jgi:RNA polymerase sigma-70 factor (sigma-E family)